MRYRIVGIDPDTRHELALIVDAPSDAAAERVARSRGIDVSSVRPESDADAPGDEHPGSEPKVILTAPAPGSVQTIELTGKPWKAILLLGAALMILGLGAGSYALLSDPRALTSPPLLAYLGAGAFIGGLLVFIVGRLGAWWYHG